MSLYGCTTVQLNELGTDTLTQSEASESLDFHEIRQDLVTFITRPVVVFKLHVPVSFWPSRQLQRYLA